MPSADLSGFGKAMFEKRMREKNMGMDPMGNFGGAMMPPPPAPTQFRTGFDNSALMQDPKFRQMDTMNQGMEVSEPYFEANKQAFSKNNPMNAISQETPVGDRVDAFIKGIARGTGGAADYMTGGLTDLDQKGDMPYQKRIKQRLGGLADFATLGITDFDGRSR